MNNLRLILVLVTAVLASATNVFASASACSAAIERARKADICPNVTAFEKVQSTGAAARCQQLAILVRVESRCTLGEEIAASMRIRHAGDAAGKFTNSQGNGYSAAKYEYLYSGENAKYTEEKITAFRSKLSQGKNGAREAMRTVARVETKDPNAASLKRKALGELLREEKFAGKIIQRLDGQIAKLQMSKSAFDNLGMQSGFSGGNLDSIADDDFYVPSYSATFAESQTPEAGYEPDEVDMDQEIAAEVASSNGRAAPGRVANHQEDKGDYEEFDAPKTSPKSSVAATHAPEDGSPDLITANAPAPSAAPAAGPSAPQERVATYIKETTPQTMRGEHQAPEVAAAQPTPALPLASARDERAETSAALADEKIPATSAALSLDTPVENSSTDIAVLNPAADATDANTAGASRMVAGALVDRLASLEVEKELAQVEQAANEKLGSLEEETTVSEAAEKNTLAENSSGEMATAGKTTEENTKEEVAAVAADAVAPNAQERAKQVSDSILAELGIPTGGPPPEFLAEPTRDPAVTLIAQDTHHPASLFHALAATVIEEESDAEANAAEPEKKATSDAPAKAPAASPENKKKEGGALAWTHAATSPQAGP